MSTEAILKYYDTQIEKLKTRLANLEQEHPNSRRPGIVKHKDLLVCRLQRWVNAKARSA